MNDAATPRRSSRFWDRAVPLLFATLLILRLVSVPPESSSLLTGRDTGIRIALLTAAVLTAFVQQQRRPLLGLTAATMTGLACTLLGYTGPGALLPAAWSLFVIARERVVRTVVVTTASVLALIAAASTVALGRGDSPPEMIVAALSLCLAASLGVVVRSRRQLVVSIRERAERAEASREEEARRRVAEDRVRIARELHDVIAHHMAIINVQTSVARHHLTSDLTQADAALHHVRRSSQLVLDELGTVLSVLRAGDAPLAPTTGSASLPGLADLIETFGASGAAITTDLHTTGVGASPESEQAIYRVVQESLTNAHRHAPDSDIHVQVHTDSHQLQVRVENGPGTSTAQPTDKGSGFGLLGLRERVESVGGTFAAEPTAHGGFLVTATVPTSSPLATQPVREHT
ncbi:MAG: sensor histidine kinase [Beutenbergiaceae bacterium]